MALDERERNFEKALARHLRPDARSENSARLQETGGGSESACPDAETLAAYHERLLLQEELISWKGHIAGCKPCQELLALLQLTDGIPVNAELLGTPLYPEQMRGDASSLLGKSPTGETTTAALMPSAKVQTIPRARNSRLRWVAPAAAIAAGLFVWIAARENKMLSTPARPKILLSRNEPAPAGPLSANGAPPAREDANQQKERQSVSPPAPLSKQLPEEKDAFARSSRVADLPLHGRNLRKLQLAPYAKADVDGYLSPNRNSAALDSTRSRALAKSEASQGAGGAQQSIEVQANDAQIVAQAPPPPLPAESQVAPSAASPTQSTEAFNKTVQDQVVAATESRSFSDEKTLTKVIRGNTRDSRLATAPGGSVVWHVGLAGFIEKSSDGGKTFTQQDSGVKSELVAASAPNDSVCWVVGRSGMILLTVDGGARWIKLVSPLQENIGGVHAADKLHATIWAVGNRTSFATSDAGTTWTRVPNE